MKFRGMGRIALAAAAVWGLATSMAQATEISFWTWRQEDKAAYNEMFADFTKLNPDITVKFESFPDENYPTIVSTALAAGHGGDVIHTHAYGWLVPFVKAGYFVPLDIATVPSIANMPADALIAGSYNGDGKLYSLPFASQTLGLFINKDVFAKAGLTPPTTWDEFITVSKALKEKGIIPLANGLGTSWFNEMFVAIFTNPFLGPDFVKDLTTGKTTFKDPRYVAALGKLLELRDYMPPGYEGVDYDTAGQLFLTGRAAMLAGGSFDIATYRAAKPQINMEFIAPPAAKAGDPPLCHQILRRRLCRERRLAEQGSRLEAGRLHGYQGLRRQTGRPARQYLADQGRGDQRPDALRGGGAEPVCHAAYQCGLLPVPEADGVGAAAGRHHQDDGGQHDARAAGHRPHQWHRQMVRAVPGQVR